MDWFDEFENRLWIVQYDKEEPSFTVINYDDAIVVMRKLLEEVIKDAKTMADHDIINKFFTRIEIGWKRKP